MSRGRNGGRRRTASPGTPLARWRADRRPGGRLRASRSQEQASNPDSGSDHPEPSGTAPATPEPREATREPPTLQKVPKLLLDESGNPSPSRSDAACARKVSKWSRTIWQSVPSVGRTPGRPQPRATSTRTPCRSPIVWIRPDLRRCLHVDGNFCSRSDAADRTPCRHASRRTCAAVCPRGGSPRCSTSERDPFEEGMMGDAWRCCRNPRPGQGTRSS